MQLRKTGEITQLQLNDIIVIVKYIINSGISFQGVREGVLLVFTQPDGENSDERFCRGDITTLEGFVKDFCGFSFEEITDYPRDKAYKLVKYQ